MEGAINGLYIELLNHLLRFIGVAGFHIHITTLVTCLLQLFKLVFKQDFFFYYSS